MLFDLQATRRRRNVVRVIYSVLVILMAASLFFVINGGVFNSSSTGSGGSNNNSGIVNAQIKTAQKATQKNPQSAAAWSGLMQAYYQAASSTSATTTTGTTTYTATGKKQLAQATTAWNKYRSLVKSPTLVNAQLAALIFDGLKQYSNATIPWQDVSTLAPSSTKAFTCLALTAYASKKAELGDAAAAEAVKLTPKLQRITVQGYFTSSKTTTATAEQYIADFGC